VFASQTPPFLSVFVSTPPFEGGGPPTLVDDKIYDTAGGLYR